MASVTGTAPIGLAPVNTSATAFIASPTMTTPRPVAATLQSQPFSMPYFDHPTPRKDETGRSSASPINGPECQEQSAGVGQGSEEPIVPAGEANGNRVDDGDHLGGEIDGRLTPLASESSRMSLSESSGPSDPQLVSPRSLSIVAPTPSLSPVNINSSAPADIGLCNLATEKQIREAAVGKDRMFLLLLSREIEGYITRITGEGIPPAPIPQTTLSSSALATLSHAFPLVTVTTSKYQRMLVYKVAEWYGLKGVAGPDGTIFIGIIGSLDVKSASLRLADIAPKPPSPKQNFKIMQRVPLGGGPGSSRGGSVIGDDSSEAGTSKRKTLEEREAQYALARERIYGRNADAVSDGQLEDDDLRGRPSRQSSSVDEEIDPVPRHTYGPNGIQVQPVYASLYHPPRPSSPSAGTQLTPNQTLQYQSPDSMFAYQPSMPVPPYGQTPMCGFPGSGAYTKPPLGGFPAQPQSSGYVDGQYTSTHNGYNGQQWQGPPVLNGQGHPPHIQGQIPPLQHMAPGWSYSGQPMNPNQPMPMIPQGLPAFQPQAAPPYGYPPQQQPQLLQQQQQQPMYAPLYQPTPLRPGPQPHPHPHSSNSSSISSRSYQDYSRPHSRGSTTSTRSAASSVRLGQMYPAGPPGYRQKGLKGQGLNGMTTLGLGERRSTRGHSPSSTTTTSSRSSRRAPSINLQAPQPGQHQLPQKPDWAANNIPYHPSPMPLPYQPGQISAGPSTSDFPPLARNGTNAEPMQVERAKMRPPNGTVWNGSVGRAAQHPPPLQQPQPQQQHYPLQQPQFYAQQSSSVAAVSQPIPPILSQTPQPIPDTDPDFPRRLPASAATLYDPTAPKVEALSSPSSPSTAALSMEDAIEAKLAALSVNSGIAIGPAPVKAPSYAKIVRRD